MNKMFKTQLVRRSLPALALVTAGAANAAVDVAAVTTEIQGNVASVVAIGGAVLGVGTSKSLLGMVPEAGRTQIAGGLNWMGANRGKMAMGADAAMPA